VICAKLHASRDGDKTLLLQSLTRSDQVMYGLLVAKQRLAGDADD